MSGGRHAGGFGGGIVDTPCGHVNDFDLDGGFGAGVDAGGFETIGEAAVAHIAFADDAALGVELGDGVGAVPDAILAADAGVGGVEDDAGDGVFGVGVDGAAFDALGIETVVATHGEIVPLGVGVGATFDLADASPADVGGVTVLLVAGDLAGAAADALGHVEVEAELLVGQEGALGDEGVYYLWTEGRFAEIIEGHANERAIATGECAIMKWKGHWTLLSLVGLLTVVVADPGCVGLIGVSRRRGDSGAAP